MELKMLREEIKKNPMMYEFNEWDDPTFEANYILELITSLLMEVE